MPNQTEIRQQITDRIVAALKQNLLPWRRPWRAGAGGLPRNIVSRRRYSGINVPLLMLSAETQGFLSPWWATYNQWQTLGGQVRRGSKGTHVVLYKTIEREIEDQEAEASHTERFWLLRMFVVFNLDQVDGKALDRFRPVQVDAGTAAIPDWGPAEELIIATKADIRHGGNRAFYRRPTGGEWPNHTGGDFIQVPVKSQFSDIGGYYGTVLHELGHWSECRLGWSGSYAMGELIAEMTAAYLTTELDVPQAEHIENHAAYLQSWLKEMQNDPKFIFQASAQASKAADYLLGFVHAPEPEPVPAAEGELLTA
ncbi:MAG: ArdC family protein [Bacillota bacterium]